MSHPNRRRPREGQAAAIARLRTEEQIALAAVAGVPIELAGKMYRPPYETLHRWGSEGKGGVYLDVLRERRTGTLVTSRPALERFARECAAAAATCPPAQLPTASSLDAGS